MRSAWLAALMIVLAVSPRAKAAPAESGNAPLTTVAAIRSLTYAEAAQERPVRIKGVVTYYQPAEQMLYVQDGTGAVYVHPREAADIHPGSEVVVSGATRGSYRTSILSSSIEAVGEAPLPKPRPATFGALINGIIDCDFVHMEGVVRSSTIQKQNGTPFLLLEIVADGGPIRVHVLHFEGIDPNTFLDATISFSAASGKTFDGKFEPVGVKLYVDQVSSIHVVSRSTVQPGELPLSPFQHVAQTYSATGGGERLRVRGTVTLYDPGEMLVLDNAGSTLLVNTHQDEPIPLGQVVDVTGFSDYSDYGPSLDYGMIFPSDQTGVVKPQAVSYDEAMTGKHAYNLVSLTGVLVAEVHETFQDTLVIKSGAHLFSAVLRSRRVALRIPDLQIGSTLQVTGVCLIDAYGPFNSPVDFTLRVRSPLDIAVVREPSWLTIRRLIPMVALLLALVIAALLWGETLRRRVASQTETIRRAAEEDAAWERRSVYLERERSVVLEAINSAQPLHSVLALIAAFIGKQILGVACSFRLASGGLGADLAFEEAASSDLPVSSHARVVRSSDGIDMAEMVLVTDRQWHSNAHIEEVLDIGGKLAALAIENRMLHERLVHRSEYDQLTDVPNRFLIEGRLERAIAEAKETRGRLAVIYVDLDDFKQVNDRYGHRVGDIFLQQAAQRLSAELRDRDLIARIGGDEFLAIVHDISGREEAEGVADRLAGCFADPFHIEEFEIPGGASIGIGLFPEDGLDGEELKRSADHAMYHCKRMGKHSRQELGTA